MRTLRGAVVFVVCWCLVAAPMLWTQEHPRQEHPQKEHPRKEHPASAPVTMADVDKAIRAHIEKTSKKNDGVFPVEDNVLKKTWELQLVKVHTDRLAHLENDVYFACVDFKASDGTAVDVDFYLKGKADKLKVTDTTV
ncbi:MAG: hypothetical protein ACRD2M_11120, partial [Terriglobales bacterium]